VFQMNDWSFGQLCRLAGVAKETVNRLTSETAAMIFRETLQRGAAARLAAASDVARRLQHG
jgi:hypothetical protein